jgi:hypothetical protein
MVPQCNRIMKYNIIYILVSFKRGLTSLHYRRNIIQLKLSNLTDVFHGFALSHEANSGIVSRLGHCGFLLKSPLIYHPSIRPSVV